MNLLEQFFMGNSATACALVSENLIELVSDDAHCTDVLIGTYGTHFNVSSSSEDRKRRARSA
jgi:hypothetical protein